MVIVASGDVATFSEGSIIVLGCDVDSLGGDVTMWANSSSHMWFVEFDVVILMHVHR